MAAFFRFILHHLGQEGSFDYLQASYQLGKLRPSFDIVLDRRVRDSQVVDLVRVHLGEVLTWFHKRAPASCDQFLREGMMNPPTLANSWCTSTSLL